MAAEGDERYLTTAEVARRLGIKQETVYAYVSRGVLHSVRSTGRRGSLFPVSEVDRLAERGREARPPSGAVERIRTAVTLIEEDELFYRGHPVTELAAMRSFAWVADLLWTTGNLAVPWSWPELLESTGDRVDVARAAIEPLPESARLTDRLRVIIAVLGAMDPLRFDLSPERVMRAAGTAVGVMVEAVAPRPGSTPGRAARPGDEPRLEGPAHDDGLGARLWPALTTRPQPPGLLESVLILMADHGLAASTVAARVAASARAHPYAVISAGLGAVDAQHHGAASGAAYRFLADAMDDPIGALSERLRAGDGVPGFGHRVYQERDPRAGLLFTRLRTYAEAEQALEAVDALVVELSRGGAWPPNVDLALAAMMHAFDMRPDAGEAVFAVARTVGWIAHALEEYREPAMRFRPLGFYTGMRGDLTPEALR
ncbi:citrate synthase [Phytoactinopolyspora halotolerans]|uniref:citrate synthase (unknown stereospecificity) n=1 Tax=Phytoactinopolyspora halotolerans TaxID=1981512 RepID=A0A6L9S1G0_9ACTN|nr:citrate synthase [Phytoactinopolyspora halotolerans]NED98892.1 helix-turn-helix domain-containing protein [Phytoactinopolyspora halotolerans]